MDETDYAKAVETDAMGFVQLLREHAKVCGQLVEGDVRRSGNQANRLGVRLSAESGPQLFVGTVVGQHVQRTRERDFRVWNERRGHRAGHQEKYRRAEKSGFSGGGRNLSGRDQRVLDREGGKLQGRDSEDPNYRLPVAVRGLCGKRRYVHQFRAVAAVEERGAAGTFDVHAGPGNGGADFLEGPRSLQEGWREVRRPDFEADLGLYQSAESVVGGSVERN